MMNCRRCTKSPVYSPACTGGCTPINHLPARPVFNFEENCDDEPEAPILSLGDRVLWITNFHDYLGTVRWIGRVPQLCPSWSAGVEFDNPVPNGGNGVFNTRRYFSAPHGHVLFLPVPELVKNDGILTDSCALNSSSIACGCEHTCNKYVNKYRDSTYGHLKRNGCPTCVQDYQLYPRYCEQAPIYGRISSRRALNHEDHSYERYVSRTHTPSIPFQKIPDNNYEDTAQDLTVNVDAGHYSLSRNSDYSTYPKAKEIMKKQHLVTSYPDHLASDTRISAKESVFIPSATVKFISGLKEWVSCWVLGTAKKKKRRKFLIKGSKTVTSVIMAQNGHSITGERLSSCNLYSDVRRKKFCDQENLKHESSSRTTSLSDTNLKKPNGASKRKMHGKKRPAPLPPHQIKIEDKAISNELDSSMQDQVVKGKDNTSGRKTASCSISSLSSKKGNTKSKENISIAKSYIMTESHKSTKKSPKKRRAPLPPILDAGDTHNAGKSGTNDACKIRPISKTFKDGEKSYSEVTLKKGSLKSQSGTTDTVNNVEQSVVVKQQQKIKHTNLGVKMKDHVGDDHSMVYKNDGGDSEGSLDSQGESISFSSDDNEDESVEWVNNGIITYQNGYQTDDSAINDNIKKTGEVCLKISIQKTETNVMTVEEVSCPSETHPDDGSYQSSLTEASSEEEAEDDVYNFDSVESRGKIVQPQQLLSAKKSQKAPKEVAKLRDSRRGSVKNLVNAFNMLAQKGGEVKNNKIEKCNEGNTDRHKLDIGNVELEEVESTFNHANLKSFPTNWQYENNCVVHYNYPQNYLLMPIEEESHTEASEHDAHFPGESDLPLQNDDEEAQRDNSCCEETLDKKSTIAKVQASHSEKIKACSHCSNHHKNISTSGNIKQSVALKKAKRRAEFSRHNSNVSDIKEKQLPGNSTTPKSPMIRASEAALTALLTGKSNAVDLSGENKGAKAKTSQHTNHSKETALKNEKAIMASLYIEDKSSHRGPMPFLVTPAMSLKKLKKKIEKQYKFPRELQCWVFGETFAIQDDSSLESYGVTETGCPILLYVMSKESKSRSLPNRGTVPSVKQHIYDDVTISSSGSESDSSQDLRIESIALRNEGNYRIPVSSTHHLPNRVPAKFPAKRTSNHGENATQGSENGNQRHPLRHPRVKHERHKSKSRRKSDYHAAWEKEYVKKKDYHTLIEMENLDLVANVEQFECPVCFLDVEPGDGTVLQECLHTFCKECLASAIQFSDTAVIKCPFRNDEYSCESHLLEREIKSLVSPEVFERHLQRSMALAESQALDSFHCKTPDCPGWCLYEDNVNTFLCPVCKHTNCVTCAAIHEGRNCRQFQDDVAFRCDSSEEAKKTKEYLDNMLKDGDAMKCPHCQVILMKKWGCDWLKCSMCHTEVCWVTKGPRWGLKGRGDTSGGCKCMVDGVKCHPKCSYCH